MQFIHKFCNNLLGKHAPSTSLLVHGMVFSDWDSQCHKNLRQLLAIVHNVDTEKFEDFVNKCLVSSLMHNPINETNLNRT